ncbi:MAG: DUF4355 domain-containing protein [Anaerostipes sp.]|nr:DUF4355 domain-containing protein [Anaerostipes sp.]
MSDFTVIETQEQLNEVIKDRLKRERETVEKRFENYLSAEDVTKKYEGYLSPSDVVEKYEGYLSPEDAAAKDIKLKEYELYSVKTKVAHEAGLPYDSIGFLSGDDEDAIRSSAEALKSLVGNSKTPPLANNEPPSYGEPGDNTAAYKELLGNLTRGE